MKEPDKCSVFIDFDGVIIHQEEDLQWILKEDASPCPGSIETLEIWASQGHNIFITTARTAEDLDTMVRWLDKHKVKYTDIILGCGRGPRYLINDIDQSYPGDKALAYCIERNEGLNLIALKTGKVSRLYKQ